jgi:ppGpp synthetase/RelA/SpoT-type nucleotidyltranferase
MAIEHRTPLISCVSRQIPLMNDPRFSEPFENEFYSRYKELERRGFFRHGLVNPNHALKALLDEKCASSRKRLRVEEGRIKTANRLLLKAQLPRYSERIHSPADVFSEIRDIVGTRITCNTTNDAYEVLNAIKAVVLAEKSNTFVLKICEDYEDDYIKAPKESGCRALSVVVGVRVAVGSTVEPVTCEVQIRTLLQDASGELTHEDTYKPEMKVPPFIVILSKRLANALAVLDEIAQDIRNELDKTEDRDTISEIPEDLTLSGAAVIPGNGIDEYPDVPRIAPT